LFIRDNYIEIQAVPNIYTNGLTNVLIFAQTGTMLTDSFSSRLL